MAWPQLLDEANKFTYCWVCLVITWGHMPYCYPRYSIHAIMRLWEQVIEASDTSLEHFIYPEVLTLPSILFPTNEPKGQPQQSVFPCFAHLSGARVEWGAFGSSSGPRLLETCCLRIKNKIICFSFSLFLDCPCLSLQASCLCCVWKAQWFQFSCFYHACPICLRVLRLPWQGVCSSPSPMLGTASPFYLSFTFHLSEPPCKPSCSPSLNRNSQRPQNPPQTHYFCPPITIAPRFIYFFNIEAGLYVHIFDLRWIIAAKKRVNNAALNYKNEYLKMKPALAEPYENHRSIMWVAVIYDLLIKTPWWRKDAVTGRQERCHIVYGIWTFILVLEAWT